MDETLKRLSPIYAVLFLRDMAWSLTLNGPVMPLYVRVLGLDVPSWGLLATALSAGLFMEVVWGVVMDRVDRGRPILAALILTSLIYPLYTIKALLPLFIVFQFAFGAMQVIVGLTARAVIAGVSSGKSAGFYMSLWFFFVTLGNIVGPILGSYIAENIGYEYAFYTSTGIIWVAALLFATTYLHQKDRQPPLFRRRRGVFSGFSELLKIGTLQRTCTITLLGFIGCAAVSSFLPIYATEKIGMATITIGSMATAGATARLVATPLMGRLSDKVNKRKLLFATLLVGAFLFSLYPFASDAWQLTFITIGVSVSFSFGVISIAIHSASSPKELGGMSFAIYGTFEDIGLMVGSFIFGIAWNALGPSSVFTIASVAAAIAAFFALTIRDQK